jgi:predicted nucleic acid-binding protein
MTLLDASILFDRIRANDPARLHARSIDGAVCGVTRAEILSGARRDAHRLQLITVLHGFQQIDIPHGMWDDVGAAHATFRAGGLTVPIIDAASAVVAISCDCEIGTLDARFSAMQRFFPQLKRRISP